MILLTFQLPTGWEMKESDLPHLQYPGLNHIDYDSQKQTLFALLDQFTEAEAENFGGRDNLVRCISPTLNQTMSFEHLKPALIGVQEYGPPKQKTEYSFLLNNCKGYWNSRFSA
ncbi:unnamed protein product [Dibothriocephalus latus]|uniref:Alpha-macroglobulin receptor-binding domain-containing protein n=1 Tax=Dibothriocephalus latus TaxID=60516 RepID=A0A3P7R6Q8_DIBLA|nr:unnamed protein product [Dibothriocephalus latus]